MKLLHVKLSLDTSLTRVISCVTVNSASHNTSPRDKSCYTVAIFRIFIPPGRHTSSKVLNITAKHYYAM